MIEIQHPSLSIERQCELLSLSRSGYYYSPVAMSEENLALLRRIDESSTPKALSTEAAISATCFVGRESG